jgi:hypothetical protein
MKNEKSDNYFLNKIRDFYENGGGKELEQLPDNVSFLRDEDVEHFVEQVRKEKDEAK